MIRASESVDKLMPLVLAAQKKFGAAIKSTTNPLYGSRYADISSVIDAVLEHLNEAGVVLMQHPALDWKQEGETLVAYVTVTTRMQHVEQWMESDLTVPAIQRGKFDAQSVGTGITYACRYALQSIFVIPREDDDGNAASGRGSSEKAQTVGKEKIAKLKEKMAPAASNEGASLFYALQPSGLYAVTGDLDLMRRIYKQFKAQHHSDKDGNFYMLGDEQLEVLKFECEQGNIPLKVLKGPNA